jgi:hypothetical protein
LRELAILPYEMMENSEVALSLLALATSLERTLSIIERL